MTDLSPLRACTRLKNLFCTKTLVSDLAPLAAATVRWTARWLTWPGDVAPLSSYRGLITPSYRPPPPSLQDLVNLTCYSTRVSDLSPLSSCRGLITLNFAGCHVSDLAPLAACTCLEVLDCSRTGVTQLAPLLPCLPHLHVLSCFSTGVRALGPLLVCRRLRALYCDRDVPTEQVGPGCSRVGPGCSRSGGQP